MVVIVIKQGCTPLYVSSQFNDSSRFEKTEEEANGHEATPVGARSMAKNGNTPGNDQAAEKFAERDALNETVDRNFTDEDTLPSALNSEDGLTT